MSQPIRPDDERLQISAALAGLRIGQWSDIRDLLMVRLRPAAKASVLARRCSPNLVFDVGVQVGAGAVSPDPNLPGEWAVGEDQIWRTAIANTRSRLRFETTVATAEEFKLTILTAGLFTTGALADLGHHMTQLGIAGNSQPIFATGLSPTMVTVIEANSARDCSAHDDVDRLRIEASAKNFCATLHGAIDDPLPRNLFDLRASGCSRFDVQGSFASGRILE